MDQGSSKVACRSHPCAAPPHLATLVASHSHSHSHSHASQRAGEEGEGTVLCEATSLMGTLFSS